MTLHADKIYLRKPAKTRMSTKVQTFSIQNTAQAKTLNNITLRAAIIPIYIFMSSIMTFIYLTILQIPSH